MSLFVVSDVHLGSRHCRSDAFDRFLDTLPPDASLVLNGDIVDHERRRLQREHAAILDRLGVESAQRPVIWLGGNHDSRYRPPNPGKIEFKDSYDLSRRLHVRHGFYFSPHFPYHKLFVVFFRLVHRIRILVGAEPVHVAQYAKHWPFLYNVLLANMRRQAADYARKNDFEAVACGHTHFPEDKTVDGIRLLNTGSWTEPHLHYVEVAEASIALRRFEPKASESLTVSRAGVLVSGRCKTL